MTTTTDVTPDTTEGFTCPTCHETYPDIDVESGYGCRWADVIEDEVCDGCYESDEESASIAVAWGPGALDPDIRHGSEDERNLWHVGDLTLSNQFWDTDCDAPEFKREYKRTDAWRGYFITTITGWTEVGAGCFLAGQSTKESDLADFIKDHEDDLPCQVIIISNRTSNVFSVAVDFFVEDENVDVWNEFIKDFNPRPGSW